MDFKVINVDPTTGKITFGFGVGTSQKVSGMQKLVQLFVIDLLKSPNRDVIKPDKGGGLIRLTEGNIDPENTNEIVSEISFKVKKVKEEMLDDQINVDIPADERLQTANLLDVSVDPDNITSYNCTIELINENEDTSQVMLDVSMFSGS